MTDLLDRLKTALADRYRIERELGRGGMAIVYLAHDEKLGREVALKVLRPELAASLGSERFLREIEIAGKLTHPNILSLYDCGEADGLLYYTMPFIDGESLHDRLEREHQLPLEDALQITREVADALGYAHSLGLVHRDIKPENILFTAGHAVVSDFGIARAVTAAAGAKLTETGLAIGTPAYMSPEQASGNKDVDARSDLYSLGCVLYEMLGGETPYSAPTPQALIAKKLSEPLPRISVVREAVPGPIEDALTKALARTPADRFATAQQFVHALAVDTAAFDRRHRLWRILRRAALGLAALLVVAVTAFGFSKYWGATQWKRAELDSNKVAVLPFRVTATDPEVRQLDQGMMDLLDAVLTGEVGPVAVNVRSLMLAWDEMQRRGEAATEDAPLRLAAHFGAGLLLDGAVVQTGALLMVNALLRQVPGGGEIARYRMEVSPESLSVVPHRMLAGLLGGQLGEGTERLATLDHQDPRAVREYLVGLRAQRDGRNDEAAEHFSQALALDSTFALAALRLSRAGGFSSIGPSNLEAVAVAERLRSRLGPRDQAMLDYYRVALPAVADTLSVEGQLAASRAFADAAPDDPDAQLIYAAHLVWLGAPLGLPDWRGQAQAALRRAWDRDSVTSAFVLQHAFLGMQFGDLDWLQRVGDQFLAVVDTTGDWWVAHRWGIAIAQGDSVTVRALRARAGAGDPAVVTAKVAHTLAALAITAGLPFADVDLVVERARRRTVALWDSGALSGVRMAVPLALGRLRDAVAIYDDPACPDAFVQCTEEPSKWIRLIHLWLAYPGLDNVAAVAADSLRAWWESGRGARGITDYALPASNADIGCYVHLYRAAGGDTLGVREAVRALGPGLTGRGRGCAMAAEALVERHEPTRTETPALDRLETFYRRGAMWNSFGAGPLVVQLLRERGQLDRALAAAREHRQMDALYWMFAAVHLRQQGDLAALTGDTAAAIRAYEHYLTLRTDPDPGVVQAEVDSVRAALEVLQRKWRQ